MHIATMTVKELHNHLQKTNIYYSYQETPAGLLLVLSTEQGIFQATFEKERKIFAQYQEHDLNFGTLLLAGTDFQIAVWQALLQIPSGVTLSYQQLANIIDRPKAYRAVANAVGDNKIAYFVPCHRVIRKTGDMCGYKWGIERKRSLLDAEK